MSTVNLLIIEMATAQDATALKDYSKKTKFKLYSFEDIFTVKYDASAVKQRYWRYLKNFSIKSIPFYFSYLYNRIRFDFKFSQDNVRKIAIEKLTFEDFEKKVKEYDIKGVIIPTEYPFLNNLILFIKKLGIKLIVVNKEHIIIPNSKITDKWIRGKPFRCDLMCCGGSVLADLWKSRLSKKDQNKIKITGIPRLDKYLEKKTLSKTELCKVLGLDPKKKIIFFPSFKNTRYDKEYYFPENLEDVKDPADLSFFVKEKVIEKTDLRPMKEEIIKSMLKIVKEHPDIQAIIKLHPDQQPNKSLSTESELLAVSRTIPGFVGVIGKPKDLDGRDIVQNADLLVGYESTMLFEGMMLNKSILVQRWRPSKKRGEIPFYEDNACDAAFSPEEFQEKMLYILKYPNKYMKKYEQGRKNFLQQFVYKIDGKSSERVFLEIKKIFK